MTDFLELIKVIVPSIVVLLVVYVMLRSFVKQNSNQLAYMRNEQQLIKMKIDAEGKQSVSKVLLPLKFQAYERMSMFLERINPSNLLTRVIKSQMLVGRLHTALLSSIRDEYEHNMSQQVYLSDAAWEHVKAAKEDVIRLINSSASNFNSDDDASKFAQTIISSGFANNNNSIEKALATLKHDIRNNFS